MHRECLDFLTRLKRHMPERFRGARTLEVGAYDVNGSARQLFAGGAYAGIDWRPGPGVTMVGLAHELPLPAGWFDVAISTETFEHDPHWRLSLGAMVRATRAGGLVIVTAAMDPRPRHGDEFAPPGEGHYANLAPDELRPFVGRLVLWEEDRVAGDLRAAWTVAG